MTAVATGAAVAAQLALQQEEEEMTDNNPAEGWEFKILRANMNVFGDPLVLKQTCAEEARAGWTLLEKFDERRLRFRRPVSARKDDAALTFDPYRSYVGMHPTKLGFIVMAAVFIPGIAALVLLAMLAPHH